MSTIEDSGKVTIPRLHAMAARGEIITMVTAYDYPSGKFADDAAIERVQAELGRPDGAKGEAADEAVPSPLATQGP